MLWMKTATRISYGQYGFKLEPEFTEMEVFTLNQKRYYVKDDED